MIFRSSRICSSARSLSALKQIAGYLGVLFIQRGEPPHGQGIACAERVLQRFAAMVETSQSIGPGGQFIADGQQEGIQFSRNGQLACRDTTAIPYGDCRFWRQSGWAGGVGEQIKFFHMTSLSKTLRGTDPVFTSLVVAARFLRHVAGEQNTLRRENPACVQCCPSLF